jgi:hypothetical protein
VDCKICGRDFGGLAYHLISQHQIIAEEYREEYAEAELLSESSRSRLGQSKVRYQPVLPHWEVIWTPEYVLDRMSELHRKKFPMNFDWAHDHEKALLTQAIGFFGSWDNALRRIGLDPKRIRLFRPTWHGRTCWCVADKAAIVAELRRRKNAGAPVSSSRIVHELAGSSFLARAKKLWGLWSGALLAAGLDPSGGIVSQWRSADRTAIVAEIRRRRRARESLCYTQIALEKRGQPLLKRATKFFGSWNAALVAVGIEPKGRYSRWTKANKAAIVAELRRRKRAGKSLTSIAVVKEKWGRALQDRAKRLFRSWNAALHAAGIEPASEDSPWCKASQAAVLAEVRRRDRAGQSLQTTRIESEKWGHPLMNRARDLFGSWTAAVLEAGVDPPVGLTSPWRKADKLDLVSEIRRRKRARESLRYSEVGLERWGVPLLKRAESLFGSWARR